MTILSNIAIATGYLIMGLSIAAMVILMSANIYINYLEMAG